MRGDELGAKHNSGLGEQQIADLTMKTILHIYNHIGCIIWVLRLLIKVNHESINTARRLVMVQLRDWHGPCTYLHADASILLCVREQALPLQ